MASVAVTSARASAVAQMHELVEEATRLGDTMARSRCLAGLLIALGNEGQLAGATVTAGCSATVTTAATSCGSAGPRSSVTTW
jgi:hypothetical protein